MFQMQSSSLNYQQYFHVNQKAAVTNKIQCKAKRQTKHSLHRVVFIWRMGIHPLYVAAKAKLSFLKHSICSVSKIALSCTCLNFWQQSDTLISFTVNIQIYYTVICRADVSKNAKKFQSGHVDVVALVLQKRAGQAVQSWCKHEHLKSLYTSALYQWVWP